MNVSIVNFGASIRIVTDSTVALVYKSQIRRVETVRDDSLRINAGDGPLDDILIKLADVIQPAGLPDVAALRDAVNRMCDTANGYEEQALLFFQSFLGELTGVRQLVQLFPTAMPAVLSSQQLLLNAVLAIDARLSTSGATPPATAQMVDLLTAISQTSATISDQLGGVLANQNANYNHIEQLRVNISDCYNQLQAVVGQLTNLSLIMSNK